MFRLEKYRPKVLDDVVGNTDTIKRFKYFAQVGNIPHMILAVSLFILVLMYIYLFILEFRDLRDVEKLLRFMQWLMRC